ncbi:hypothetical protein EB796_011137 [Bugula neritina]|uniref:Uncharacterized protein n=1 Tax=Bugula neritina TaxID=10212 RepID=A0A7J7JYX2_BUGNE|nr:hypothetical protein EB796_011137 [Bugula neritina]
MRHSYFQGETTRSVKQFFVSFWPDFGCPDRTESLLNLVRVVRSHMRPEGRGPLVVHCSAGVGRTGTYVAVDRLLQRIQDHDEIDIFSLVMEMREYRCRMVQTEDQYIYIHDCIKEALLSSMSKRYTPLPQDDENDDGPIYENASVQSPVLDTQMVSLAIDANGSSEPSGNVKNTEL